MSYADQVFIENCRDILQNGIWDTDQNVRPKWEDGTPAHTVKKFGIVNLYDLRKEFPILTLRRTYYRSAITNPTGTAPHENVPWTYTWNNDGDLHCAYESWPVGKEPDPDDIRTEYYFYTSDANPTLGAVFDITAQIVQGLEGFYFYGRGTAHLPSYVNTAYRNKAKTFSYKWSTDKKSITEITIERWPFANDHDFSSLKYTHIWRFTYYQ